MNQDAVITHAYAIKSSLMMINNHNHHNHNRSAQPHPIQNPTGNLTGQIKEKVHCIHTVGHHYHLE